jgi:diacylglycerol O-acyltransferase / wax synthase
MARDLNHRLTTTDAAFLYVEKPTEPMNIGGCLIYDGHVSADELARVLEQRLHEIPRYRQRVMFPPFGLAHPTWEDDPGFDLADHIEEITLPAPADDLMMSTVGGEFYGGVLDRRHPLWKVILLQGRPDGNTAMVWKIHHAMVDGVSGVEITMVVHDFHPEGDPRPPAPQWKPRALPDSVVQFQDAIRDQLTDEARRWTDAVFRLLRPADSIGRDMKVAAALLAEGPKFLRPAPRTPFNAPLSGERDFAWIELPLADVREIKGTLGGTVNDVVLAIISGGLGRFLRARRYPTDGVELRTMCPVSLRPPEMQDSLGNLVSFMAAPLYVGIEDPVERLAAQRSAMEALKKDDQAGRFHELADLANLVPPGWQALTGRLFEPSITVLNTVTTNMPGPQVPLYLAGRKLLHWYPLGPLSATIGLFNSILSYNKMLTIGVTVDSRLVPDVRRYTEFLRESFVELRDAARDAAPVRVPALVPVAA